MDAIIADAICDAVATTPQGLGSVLESLGNPINPATWYRWLQEDSEAGKQLRERYMRARADQARLMAEEIAEIADNTQVGEVETIKGDGTIEIRRSDMIEHRKLRIEARKWLAAKLLPKVYGDRQQMEHTGADGGEIVIRHIGSPGSPKT